MGSSVTPTYILINVAITVLLIAIGWIIIRYVQNKKMEENPEGYGDRLDEPVTGNKTMVVATVLGITRALRNPGDPEAYQVICKYTDPETGREETFTSKIIRQYPGKEIIGKMVKVYLDPREPGKYTVDLDSME
ncbi:MAG: hypothetical protein VZR02_06585 [Lachnospiraceae bacterium]|nr:hypothetical protein [Lachnospiraceae bacterium]